MEGKNEFNSVKPYMRLRSLDPWLVPPILVKTLHFQLPLEMKVYNSSKMLYWDGVENKCLYLIKEWSTMKPNSPRFGTRQGHEFFYIGMPIFIYKRSLNLIFSIMCVLHMSRIHSSLNVIYWAYRIATLEGSHTRLKTPILKLSWVR